MRRVQVWVSVVVAVSLVCSSGPGVGGWLFAQEGVAGAKPATVKPGEFMRSITLKPGELTGTVLYPDGKTPAAESPVRVWSCEEKKFVYETTTDENGKYKLPVLKEGRYFLVFDDRVIVDLRVDALAELAEQPLNVTIPRGRSLLSREELAEELALLTDTGKEEKAGRRLLPTWLKVTAAGIIATAIGFVGSYILGGGGAKARVKRVIVSP